MIGKHYTAGQI